MGAVADPAGELRVADRVAAAGGEHEVGDADDLDRLAGELGLGAEGALVDDALAALELLAGALDALVDVELAEVDRVREAGEVAALVLGAEAEEDLGVGAGRRLLDALGAKPDAKLALRRAKEARRSRSGRGGSARLPRRSRRG